MKTKYITIILIAFLLYSCVDKQQPCNPTIPPPFKPVLEKLITELIDSLKNEIGEKELLSIQFFELSVNDFGFTLRIFLSDWYLSGSVDAYTKYGNTTIALYGLVNDYHELVNKNSISFFTDTIDGFKDGWPGAEGEWDSYDHSPPQFYCLIHNTDSISVISTGGSFWALPSPPFIRNSRNENLLVTWTPSEEFLKQRFYEDSIEAEKNLKYYQKEVKYYRGKRSE